MINDTQLTNLRARSDSLTREQATLERAVQTAQQKLEEAQASLDDVETSELVGEAKPRDVQQAQSAVDTATASLRDAKAAAENNHRLVAKLIGQRAVIEDRFRARVRPELEKRLKDALTEHVTKAKALAESQQALDELRESVLESFGVHTAYNGGTRLRGWSHDSTGSPALLPLTTRFKTFEKDVERFLTAARAQGVRV